MFRGEQRRGVSATDGKKRLDPLSSVLLLQYMYLLRAQQRGSCVKEMMNTNVLHIALLLLVVGTRGRQNNSTDLTTTIRLDSNGRGRQSGNVQNPMYSIEGTAENDDDDDVNP